ncbi:phospholipase A and acyltransferase 2-like isoform X2 [Pyxicephalus adspersus]|uniref:LRAT domain-containing protein n=1 Tax=Pyxicephalus adspersus TaxID=30357 RepID=A0AAV3A1W0_PYXAD|nr:TPA: hypothetical protein GDO54_018117 [Pyxicephalus adspersus]
MPLCGDSPNRGDLIQFLGFGFDHWGVYVGDDFVVHITAGDGHWSLSSGLGNAGLSSGIADKAIVKREHLEVVANGRNYKVNNYLDNKRTPRPTEEIVKKVEREVGKERWYHITNANCEHFATKMRYGYSHSEQLIYGLKSLSAASVTAFIGDFCFVPTIGIALGIATLAVFLIARDL